MATFRERFAGARKALLGEHQSARSPLVVDATPGDDADTEPSVVIPLHGGGRGPSHFERQRAEIDTFDEDYADRWGRVKLLAAEILGLMRPIVAGTRDRATA